MSLIEWKNSLATEDRPVYPYRLVTSGTVMEYGRGSAQPALAIAQSLAAMSGDLLKLRATTAGSALLGVV